MQGLDKVYTTARAADAHLVRSRLLAPRGFYSKSQWQRCQWHKPWPSAGRGVCLKYVVKCEEERLGQKSHNRLKTKWRLPRFQQAPCKLPTALLEEDLKEYKWWNKQLCCSPPAVGSVCVCTAVLVRTRVSVPSGAPGQEVHLTKP